MNRTIVCYAEGKGDTWEAICLDLDIAVQGNSLEQVHRDLIKAVEMHLEYVATLPEHERHHLAHRPVPLFVRFGYAWRLIMGALFPRRGDGDSGRAEFAVTCSA